MRWYLVLGRIEFDDEDTAHVCQAIDPEVAKRLAEDNLRDEDNEGLEFYVTYVVDCGETEPVIIERP